MDHTLSSWGFRERDYRRMSLILSQHYIAPSSCDHLEAAGAVLKALDTFSQFSFFLFKMFVYSFSRDRESRGGAERGGDRESQAGSSLSVQSPAGGLISQTMSSWAESTSRVGTLTDRATQEPSLDLQRAFHVAITEDNSHFTAGGTEAQRD